MKEVEAPGRTCQRVVVLRALLLIALMTTTAVAAEFAATGNTDPDKVGNVAVTFDKLPTSMSFELPTFAMVVTENGIRSVNTFLRSCQ